MDSDILTKVKNLVLKRTGTEKQIDDLQRKLYKIKDEIKELCQHHNVKKIREYDYHRAEHFYHCPICERYIGYTAYREYCIRNNLKQ